MPPRKRGRGSGARGASKRGRGRGRGTPVEISETSSETSALNSSQLDESTDEEEPVHSSQSDSQIIQSDTQDTVQTEDGEPMDSVQSAPQIQLTGVQESIQASDGAPVQSSEADSQIQLSESVHTDDAVPIQSSETDSLIQQSDVQELVHTGDDVPIQSSEADSLIQPSDVQDLVQIVDGDAKDLEPSPILESVDQLPFLEVNTSDITDDNQQGVTEIKPDMALSASDGEQSLFESNYSEPQDTVNEPGNQEQSEELLASTENVEVEVGICEVLQMDCDNCEQTVMEVEEQNASDTVSVKDVEKEQDLSVSASVSDAEKELNAPVGVSEVGQNQIEIILSDDDDPVGNIPDLKPIGTEHDNNLIDDGLSASIFKLEEREADGAIEVIDLDSDDEDIDSLQQSTFCNKRKIVNESSFNSSDKSENMDKSREFYCSVCDIDCKTSQGFQNHERGIHHSLKIQIAQYENDTKESEKTIELSGDDEVTDETNVDVNGTNPEIETEHQEERNDDMEVYIDEAVECFEEKQNETDVLIDEAVEGFDYNKQADTSADTLNESIEGDDKSKTTEDSKNEMKTRLLQAVLDMQNKLKQVIGGKKESEQSSEPGSGEAVENDGNDGEVNMGNEQYEANVENSEVIVGDSEVDAAVVEEEKYAEAEVIEDGSNVETGMIVESENNDPESVPIEEQVDDTREEESVQGGDKDQESFTVEDTEKEMITVGDDDQESVTILDDDRDQELENEYQEFVTIIKDNDEDTSTDRVHGDGTPVDPLYCAACDFRGENEQAYHMHCRGMMHTLNSGRSSSEPAKKPVPINYSALVEKTEEACKPERTIKTLSGDDVIVIDQAEDESEENQEEVNWIEETDQTYYCEVCECCMTGPQTFEAHVRGSRHVKNVKNREAGAPIRKPKGKTALASSHAKVVDQPPKAQAMIDACKDPLIGLQCVTEFCHPNEDVEPVYACNLCESKCDIRLLMQHLIGLRHRIKYMKENYMNFAILVQQRVKKSDQTPIAETYAREIEEKEGRQKMVVRLDTGIENSASNDEVFKRTEDLVQSLNIKPSEVLKKEDKDEDKHKDREGSDVDRYDRVRTRERRSSTDVKKTSSERKLSRGDEDKSKKRSRSRDRSRNRSRSRHRSRSRDRNRSGRGTSGYGRSDRRDRSRSRNRSRSRERRRERSRERRSNRDRSRSRDQNRDRPRSRGRDRSRSSDRRGRGRGPSEEIADNKYEYSNPAPVSYPMGPGALPPRLPGAYLHFPRAGQPMHPPPPFMYGLPPYARPPVQFMPRPVPLAPIPSTAFAAPPPTAAEPPRKRSRFSDAPVSSAANSLQSQPSVQASPYQHQPVQPPRAFASMPTGSGYPTPGARSLASRPTGSGYPTPGMRPQVGASGDSLYNWNTTPYGGTPAPGPSSYPTQTGPGQYPTQTGQGQYSSQAGPGQYSSQTGPGQYSSQTGPGQYSSQTGQYSSQTSPSSYHVQSSQSQYPAQAGQSSYSQQAGSNQYSQQAGLGQNPPQAGPSRSTISSIVSSVTSGLASTDEEALEMSKIIAKAVIDFKMKKKYSL